MVEADTAITARCCCSAAIACRRRSSSRSLYPYLSGEKQAEKRVASVTENRAKKRIDAGAQRARQLQHRRKKQVADTLKDIEDARRRPRRRSSLRLQLQRAGLDIDAAAPSGSPAPSAASVLSARRVHLRCAALDVAWLAIAAPSSARFGLPRWVLSSS